MSATHTASTGDSYRARRQFNADKRWPAASFPVRNIISRALSLHHGVMLADPANVGFWNQAFFANSAEFNRIVTKAAADTSIPDHLLIGEIRRHIESRVLKTHEALA